MRYGRVVGAALAFGASSASAEVTREHCLELLSEAARLEAESKLSLVEMSQAIADSMLGAEARDELLPTLQLTTALEQKAAAAWETIQADLGDFCRDKL